MAGLRIEDGITEFFRYHGGVGANGKVLIVEDDPLARQMYRTALTFAGFDIIEAQDGLAALRILDQHTADIVLLDLNLPKLDGLTVQQEIAAHAHTSDIPVVIVTGSDAPLDHINVPCVLRKPVTGDDLVAAVRRCLAAGASGAQS